MGRNKKFYAGTGAFNLVKRSVYQSIGEHNRLRLEVLDDVMLGKLIAFSGFACAMAYGKGLLSLTWYGSVKEMVAGFEKNGFAAMEYSVFSSFLLGISMAYFYFLPFVVVFFAPPLAQAGFLLSFFLMQGVFFEVARQLGYNPLIGLFVPFSSWLVYFAQIRSVFLNLTRGRVIWRDTSYSLRQLKHHRKRLFHGVR